MIKLIAFFVASLFNFVCSFFDCKTPVSNHLEVLAHHEKMIANKIKQQMMNDKIDRYADFEWLR